MAAAPDRMGGSMSLGFLEKMEPAVKNGGFWMEGYWVWCASVVKGEDGRYHMFASRWPKTQKMHPGWLLASEVVRAVSDTPYGPFIFQEVVLPVRGAQYFDGRATHNPRIVKHGDTYYLYYIGTTHPFRDPEGREVVEEQDPRVVTARANKRIGLACSQSVFGPWTRPDKPILEPRPGCFDSFLVSNPSPIIWKDGSVYMMYKSRGYIEPPYDRELHGPMRLGAARADFPLGEYRPVSDRPLFGNGRDIIEDPFIWYQDGIYEMVAKDMTGKICGEKYGGVHGSSLDGVNWKLHYGELAYSRHIMWDDGTEQELGNMDRPFILFEDGKPVCMYFAVSDGTESFYDASGTGSIAVPFRKDAEDIGK